MSQAVGGFILAAGEGRRLRPATLVCPKALVPFCGVPLLELIAARLHALHPSALGLNVCTQADRVAESAIRCGERLGFTPRISREDHLLDTGGGIREGAARMPGCEHVLVHNVDTIMDFDLRLLIDRHLRTGAAATLLLIPGRGPRTVDLDEQGRVREFRKPRGQGRYTFAGVHILRRDLLDYLPDRSACSIIEAYERAFEAGLDVQGLPVGDEDYWADLGTARTYIRAHGEILDCPLRHDPALRTAQGEQARRRNALEQAGVLCTGALGLGGDIDVAPGSQLHNAVLWDGTRLARPLLYADGIFTGSATAPPRDPDADRLPDPRLLRALDLSGDPESTVRGSSAGCRPALRPGGQSCGASQAPSGAGNAWELIPLQKQGSGRRYCRLADGTRSWVWCAYEPERRENAGFAAIADFLAGIGVRVPEVVLHLPDTFELVSRDLGQHDLQHLPRARQPDYLHKVARQIARLHVLGEKAVRLEELPLQRGFTKGLYDWERDYFRQHILETLLGRPELWGPAAREHCELRTRLLLAPAVPIHRDLQSANIMIVDNEPYLIDFQGMRMGCAAYDLAALLYDPYQCFPKTIRDEVWDDYCAAVRELEGIPPERTLLHDAAVQRLLQALGAYGKLWQVDGLHWYQPFIESGLTMLRAAAQEAPHLPGFEQLAKETLQALPDKGLAGP